MDFLSIHVGQANLTGTHVGYVETIGKTITIPNRSDSKDEWNQQPCSLLSCSGGQGANHTAKEKYPHLFQKMKQIYPLVGNFLLVLPSDMPEKARKVIYDGLKRTKSLLEPAYTIKMISEPQAAIYAHDLQNGNVEKKYLVVNMDAFKFEVHLVEVICGYVDILATYKDHQNYPHLKGGEGMQDYANTEINKFLNSIGIALENIDNAILCGENAITPKILTDLFATEKIRWQPNRDGVLSLGGAKFELAQKGAKLTMEKIPFSIGIEKHGSEGIRLISRNDPLPSRVTQKLNRVMFFNRESMIRLYKGESKLQKDNIPLATFKRMFDSDHQFETGQLTVEVSSSLDIKLSVESRCGRHRFIDWVESNDVYKMFSTGTHSRLSAKLNGEEDREQGNRCNEYQSTSQRTKMIANLFR